MSNDFIHVHALDEIQERKPTYLAIGSFDGVHLGHQEILKRLVGAADAEGMQAAVMTFFPHPKRVVQKLSGRYYLSTLQEREKIIADMGVNLLITHPFNETVRHTKAAHFMNQLAEVMALKQLWGGDFALGHNREGNVPFLRNLGREMGFTVETTDHLVKVNEQIVSSSRIRERLQEGDVVEVRACLGRPYQITGPIIYGDQRGRTIGFPTANVDVWEEQLLPQNGVYATVAVVEGKAYKAATNIGIRPTVDGQTMRVEAHLLDFEGDLYGRQLSLRFVAHIRPEMKFDGLQGLMKQIEQDVELTRHLVSPADLAIQ